MINKNKCNKYLKIKKNNDNFYQNCNNCNKWIIKVKIKNKINNGKK